jgi:hypothetical protein
MQARACVLYSSLSSWHPCSRCPGVHTSSSSSSSDSSGIQCMVVVSVYWRLVFRARRVYAACCCLRSFGFYTKMHKALLLIARVQGSVHAVHSFRQCTLVKTLYYCTKVSMSTHSTCELTMTDSRRVQYAVHIRSIMTIAIHQYMLLFTTYSASAVSSLFNDLWCHPRYTAFDCLQRLLK